MFKFIHKFSYFLIIISVFTSEPILASGVGLVLHKKPIPINDIKFNLPNSSHYRLSDFKDNFVVLNIWATWCEPCRREMPSLERLSVLMEKEGVIVLTISQDRAGAALVPQFFNKLRIKNLRPYLDSSGRAQRTLGITVMPTTILINKSGLEVARFIGETNWASEDKIQLIRSLNSSTINTTFN